MRADAVLFDLDGTLLDTLRDLTDACNYAMRTLGYPEFTTEQVSEKVGDGVPALMLRALPSGHTDDLEQAIALFRGWYAAHAADHTAPYPGIHQVLTRLGEAGVGLGVVTNKPQYAVEILVKRFFPQVRVMVGDAPGRKVKPAPDTGNAAMLALGVDRESTVYVGDSDTDLETAKNLGIPCIGAAWGFRGRAFLEAHGAKLIADEPADILKILGEQYAF